MVLIFSLSLNNFGRQINGFTDIEEKVPISLKFGMSKSLNHLPFTYYISLHDLQRFDISGPVQASQSYRDDETILKKMFYHVNQGLLCHHVNFTKIDYSNFFLG